MKTSITVQEAAARTGLSAHTLRYYERIGLIPRVSRAGNSHRRYSDLDLDWIVFVSRLRSTGMAIADIRRYTDLVRAGSATVAERLALLDAHHERLAREIEELGENLALLERKIADYRAQLDPTSL